MGLERADDAGVYLINEELAIIQTVDFFTPVVDDPYYFGQIAAANALSDVYAMGGVPKTAMNLVGFPIRQMDISVLKEILRGGIEKLKEAGAVLVGGHSVEDNELKYGLAVTGFVHPKKVLTKRNLRPGDLFILTKPLGTGIATTAIKAGLASHSLINMVTRSMAALNKGSAEVMALFEVHACTDITGFGFLGHLAEMVVGASYGVEIWAQRVPVFDGIEEMANMGLVPAGAYRNRDFRKEMVEFDTSVPRYLQDILFDPQTSGGLLICVSQAHGEALLEGLHRKALYDSRIVGRVLGDRVEKIFVRLEP